MSTYLIQDNGSRPYKVTIDGNLVKIYKEISDDVYTEQEILSMNSTRIFIGESPENTMTLYSGAFGDDFLGNSILFEVSNNEYVFINRFIFKFQSLSNITRFVSPVGNNDVPYPYAFDEQGNAYLLSENVVLLSYGGNDNDINKDPYDYYYKRMYITHHSIVPVIQNFREITNFFINDEEYNMSVGIDPAKDYDRLISEDYGTGNGLSVQFTDGQKKILSKSEYVEIIENYFTLMQFQRINILMTFDTSQ